MPGERIKRFLNRFIHIDENRNRTPSPQSQSRPPSATPRLSCVRQNTPSPPLAPSTRLQSPIPSPEPPFEVDEGRLRAIQADVRRKSEALEEELAQLEKRAQELEHDHNARLLQFGKRAQELEHERNARLLELGKQVEEAEEVEKKLGVQTTRLHELNKLVHDAEEEIGRRREALEARRRELKGQAEEEVELAKAEAMRHTNKYETFPVESPVQKLAPWDPWELDPNFFSALSRWTLDNPESTLDRVLQKISAGIDQGQPLLELIPDSPFPARGLVGALAHLLKLGAAVSRAQKDVRDFAIQIIRWVGEMKAAFEGGVMSREGLSWRMQANLETRGNLIQEICVWATAILKEGRWKQIKRGLSVTQQIEDFKARIAEVRSLFLDASLINLSQGLNKIWKEIEIVREAQDKQLKDINDRLDAEKHAEARSRFMDQTLQSRLVANPTYDAQGKKPCDPDTRIAILKGIREWLEDFSNESKSFLWLTGEPGSGKSSITASVARECKDNGTLWAQFFVNRNNVDTTDPQSFFPSIVLANHSPNSDVARTIHDTLKKKQSLLDDISAEQASALFVDAVTAASKLDGTKAVVVVIDGLDEMDRSRLAETAKIFSSMFEKLRSPNVKVFVASRTEDDIRKPFGDTFNAQYVRHVHLDTAEESSILDVSKFMTQKITEIVEKHDLNWEEWPGERRMQMLCDRASGLFIWAVTVAKFIQEQILESGTECLDDLLDELSKEGMDGVNILYGTILRLTYKKPDEWALETFRRVVGCIVVLREPLCIRDIKDLLKLRKSEGSNAVDILNFVRRLRTVLVAGADAIDDETVPRLHKSFFEFITSDRADPRFRVESNLSDGELAVRCLDQLAHFRKEYHTTNDVPDLPPLILGVLRYAVRFWALHLPQRDGSTSGLAITARTTPLSTIQKLLTSNLKIKNLKPLGIQVPQDGSGVLISWDKSITSWDPVTRQEPKWTIQTEADVCSVAFSPDGTQIVSSGSDFRVRFWHARRGWATGLGSWDDHTGTVKAVAFSPDGTQVVSGSQDKTIKLWDVQTYQVIGSPLKGHTDAVWSVAFSPDGTQIVSSSSDTTIRLWDVKTRQAIGSALMGHRKAVLSVGFSPDGTQIVSGSNDKTIRLWNVRTGQTIGSALEGHVGKVLSVAFSPDGTRIVSNSSDNTIRLWDVETRQAIFIVSMGHGVVVLSIGFSPDGTQLVSGCSDKTIRIWDGQTGRLIRSCSGVHTGRVLFVAFSPDGARVVSCSDDKTISLWNTQTGQPFVAAFPAQESWVSSVAPFPDGSRVISASLDGTVSIWHLKHFCQIGEPLITKTEGFACAKVSPDGTQIAAATVTGTIYLWDAESRKLLSQAETSLDGITSLKFSLNGSELILACVDGLVLRFNAKDGKLMNAPISQIHSVLSKTDNAVSFDMQRGWQSGGSDAALHWIPFEDSDGGLWAYVDGKLIRSNGADSVTVFDLESA